MSLTLKASSMKTVHDGVVYWKVKNFDIQIDFENIGEFDTARDWCAGERSTAVEELTNIEKYLFKNFDLWSAMRDVLDISLFPNDQIELTSHGTFVSVQFAHTVVVVLVWH